MLTVVVNTISNSQVFLLKNVSSFCKCKSYSHFFSKNISPYAIFNDQCFNVALTNDTVHFEQLGPDFKTNLQVVKLPCVRHTYSNIVDTSTCSRMDYFIFYDEYGKLIMCPNT